MKTTLVIGSGVSGLTAALLQAQKGRQVVLVEKLPAIGGYLSRFTRLGHRFDTGLHFTGGFGHILSEMLRRLGIEDVVRPAPLTSDILMADSGLRLELPNSGLQNACASLSAHFPGQASAIGAYYAAEQEVINHTTIFNLERFTPGDLFSMMTPYDATTVHDLLDSCGITSPELRTILPVFSLCHGSPPDVTPFPYHCRCAYNMETNLTAVVHGGDAFLQGFQRELAKYGVSIRTGTTVESLRFDETSFTCTGARLSNGEDMEVESVHFAVNPQAFLHLFPEHFLPLRLRRRIHNLMPTCSFFTIYGYLDGETVCGNRLTFFMKRSDLKAAMHPGGENYSTGIVTSTAPGNPNPTITAFRTMFPDEFEKKSGVPFDGYRLAPAYVEAKQKLTDSLVEDILAAYPSYRGRLHIVCAASPYTCRRYSPPLGSAYGTQQLLGASRPAGRLPVQNCFVLGHHVQFPGILGCMLGAFIQDLLENQN